MGVQHPRKRKEEMHTLEVGAWDSCLPWTKEAKAAEQIVWEEEGGDEVQRAGVEWVPSDHVGAE